MKKERKAGIAIFIIVIFTLAVYVMSFSGYEGRESVFVPTAYSVYGDAWQSMDSVEDIDGIDAERIAIKGYFKYGVEDEKRLLSLVTAADVSVTQNGKEVFENTDNLAENEIAFAFLWIGNIAKVNQDEEVIAEFVGDRSVLSAKSFIQNSYCGSKLEILNYEIKNHAVKIITAVFMMCIGFALFGLALVVTILYKHDFSEYIYCGAFLLIAGFATILDYKYMSLLWKDISLLNLIDYIGLALIFVFLILYLKSFVVKKPLKILAKILIAGVMLSFGVGVFIMYCTGHCAHDYVQWQLILCSIGILVITGGLVYEFLKYKTKNNAGLLISEIMIAVFMTVDMIVYFMFYSLLTVLLQAGVLIFIVMQFYSVSIKIKNNAEKQKEIDKVKLEIAESRLKVMLAQMHPHFIFNTLSSISMLCKKDPDEASRAIEDFSVFLRGNINLLNAEELVRCSQEIEYVKGYVNIEKRRFPKILDVQYNIEADWFKVPAFSIQPFVENAIRHGIKKKGEPGWVRICTKEEEERYIIEVEDNGAGFDIDKSSSDDADIHIGMQNPKDRIEKMTGGTVLIESEIGKGTIVRIEIPKR